MTTTDTAKTKSHGNLSSVVTSPTKLPIRGKTVFKGWKKVTGALQENILTLLCFDKEACPVIIAAVDTALFESVVYRNIADKAIAYFRKYKEAAGDHLPDLLEDYLNSKKRSEVRMYSEALHDLHSISDSINRKYVLDELHVFVRQQTLRQTITSAAEELLAGQTDTAERLLLEGLERAGMPQSSGPLARVRSDKELRKLKIPPVQDAAYPIVQFPGITMVSGAFGSGKTFFVLKLAMAVSAGEGFFNYDVENPLSVLFMDFELPLATLKQRRKSVRRTFPHRIDTSRLTYWSAADCYPAPKPNLADLPQIGALVQQCADYDLVIVDNLSHAMIGVDMNLAESYDAVQEFTMQRRHAGKSTILLQHVGKDKARGPRGSSRQEDWCDVSLMLNKTINRNGNAVVKVSCRKMRNHSENAFEPIEIELANVAGKFTMEYKPLTETKSDGIAEEYRQLLEEGLIKRGTQKALADKYGVDKSVVSRVAQRVTRQYRKEKDNQSKDSV